MGIFAKIKNIFFKNKIKRIAEKSDKDKIIKIILKEKDPDKIIELLSNNKYSLTSDEIASIIEKLPINRRVEAMKLIKNFITPYDTFELINKKLDGYNKLEALKEFQDQLDLYNIYTIFDNLSPDRRTTALELCIDRFDSFSLGEIIEKYIPLSQRAEMLYKYNDQIDSFSKAEIIKKLVPQEIIDSLEKFVNELNANSIVEIINSLPSDNKLNALKISYKKLSQNQIKDIIMYEIDKHQRLESLEFCSDKLDISSKTDIIKYGLTDKEKENAIMNLSDSLDSSHVSDIIDDIKISAKFLKTISSKFDIQDEEIK